MKKKLLLHICCGPCASHVLEVLVPDYQVTAYFYNPNVEPEDEYQRRLEAARKSVEAQSIASLQVGPWDNDSWRQAVKGLEDEPEGGKRCLICYSYRLEQCAREAKRSGMECLASTLTVGPGKKAAEINRLGAEIVGRYGIEFLAADFKKRDGFKRSVELSKGLGLYRQEYCGCLYGK